MARRLLPSAWRSISNTAILSADSRQFYQELNIGTAKLTEEELAQAPHHLINSLSIKDEYSVGAFERDALQVLHELFQKHDVLILAGGSGLYIKALCEGLDEFPEVPMEIRKAIEEEYQEKGLSFLQDEVARIDPEYYEQVDQQNPHRLIRAISVFRAGWQTLFPFQKSRPAVSSVYPYLSSSPSASARTLSTDQPAGRTDDKRRFA